MVQRCRNHLDLPKNYDLFDLFYLAMQRDCHALAMHEAMEADPQFSDIREWFQQYSPVKEWADVGAQQYQSVSANWMETAKRMARGGTDSLVNYCYRYLDLYELAADLRQKMGRSQEQLLPMAADTMGRHVRDRRKLHHRSRAVVAHLAHPANVSSATYNAAIRVTVVSGRPLVVRRN